jgi:hypothetical protein
MKNLISDNEEFLKGALAIFAGIVLGITGAHLIQTATNLRVQKTCDNKIVAIKTLLTTESFYCVKQTD